MRNALIAVLALAACQYSENRHLKREVSRSELIGSWIATPFAIQSLRDAGSPDHLALDDHKMVLRPDGTCSLRTTFGLPFTPYYRVYDQGCSWNLGNVGEQSLIFTLAPQPDTGNPYFYFAEDGGKLLIWWYADDPDAWRYLEFERQGVQQDPET
jgi:hypothetical protein